jgi:hypothetical protein
MLFFFLNLRQDVYSLRRQIEMKKKIILILNQRRITVKCEKERL